MLRSRSFTLVELLVVIVIIGILVALILPNTLRAINQANTKECASNIRAVDTAIQMFYTENRAWPATVNPDLLPYFPDEDGDGTGDEPICDFTGGGYGVVADAATGGVRCDKTGHFTGTNWPNTHN